MEKIKEYTTKEGVKVVETLATKKDHDKLFDVLFTENNKDKIARMVMSKIAHYLENNKSIDKYKFLEFHKEVFKELSGE